MVSLPSLCPQIEYSTKIAATQPGWIQFKVKTYKATTFLENRYLRTLYADSQNLILFSKIYPTFMCFLCMLCKYTHCTLQYPYLDSSAVTL